MFENCESEMKNLVLWYSETKYVLLKAEALDIDLYIQPAKMFLICENKTCEVLDESGENVNSIYIRKTITAEK